MKRGLLLVLAACGAGCATDTLSNPPRNAHEARVHDLVRRDFERWNDANERGDVAESWAGLADSRKQEWLRNLMKSPDGLLAEHLARLNEYERTLIDKWVKILDKNRAERAEGLPASLLYGRWIYDLYTAYFERAKTQTREEAAHRTIKDIYPGEDGGVTILTDRKGLTEMYGLRLQGDRWKVEVYRQPMVSK